MTLTELFNYVVNLVNENPVMAITSLIAVLEMLARNIQSEKNLSLIQNAIKILTIVVQALDWAVPNKTSTPNVVYTTELSVSRVEVKPSIEPEESIS